MGSGLSVGGEGSGDCSGVEENLGAAHHFLAFQQGKSLAYYNPE